MSNAWLFLSRVIWSLSPSIEKFIVLWIKPDVVIDTKIQFFSLLLKFVRKQRVKIRLFIHGVKINLKTKVAFQIQDCSNILLINVKRCWIGLALLLFHEDLLKSPFSNHSCFTNNMCGIEIEGLFLRWKKCQS